MKFAALLSNWNLILWIANIMLEFWMLVEIFRRNFAPSFIVLRVYVVFLLVSDIGNIGVSCLTPWQIYWYIFWWGEILRQFLQAFICVQLTAVILNDIASLVKIYSIGFISALAYTCTRSLPTGYTSTMLLISGNADYVCGLILMLLAIRPSAKWPTEYRGIIIGLLWSLVSHLGCTVWHSHTAPQHFWMVRLAYPAASLITMCIWLTGVIVCTHKKPLAKHRPIGYSSQP